MHRRLSELLARHLPEGTGPPTWVDSLLADISETVGDFDMRALAHTGSSPDVTRAPFRGRPDLLLKIDRAGTIVEAIGPTLALGPSCGEVAGLNLTALSGREVSEAFRDALERVDSTGSVVDFAYETHDPGMRRVFQGHVIPVLDDVRLVIVRDLSALSAALDAVERQRSFLRQIIDLNPSFIFAKDREGRFTLVNQAVAAAYGTTVDRLVGRTDAEFNPDAEQVAHFRRCDMQVIESRREMLIPEEPITDSEGNERWLQTIKRPIVSPDGRVSHVLGVATDITQRKIAEREMDKRTRRIERQVQTMIELALLKGGDRRTAFQRIAELASRTVEVGRASIWLFNDDRTGIVCQAAHHQGGPPARQVLELKSAEHPLYFAELEESRIIAVEDARLDPRTCEFFAHYLEPLGIVSMLDVAILLDGRPAGVICLEHTGEGRRWSPEERQFAASLADVAARVLGEGLRHQLEDQLRHSQKMEAIGALAGGVAHDFNNLLTGILGYCGMIEHLVRPEDPVSAYAGEIRRAGSRAAALTRQLLAFSRRQILDPRVLDLNAVISEMEGLLQRMIGERHEIAVILPGDAGAIRADRGQLEQILMNLVVNARDAMDQGGRIRIETGVETIDERRVKQRPDLSPGTYVCLTVADTGHGMDEATLGRIFEPFFTTKEKGRGTGLGLSTVYGIVQQSRWDIEVESRPGAGTTFRIRIPRLGAAPARASAPARLAAVAPVRGTGSTILLVEDEGLVRHLAREFLHAAGYTVLEAPGPGEAILAAETHPGPIALLLTDMMMPRLTGRALFDRLHPVRPEMRVLYMSGYTGTGIVQDSVLDPGANFLPKPFTSEELIAKVEAVLAAVAAETATQG